MNNLCFGFDHQSPLPPRAGPHTPLDMAGQCVTAPSACGPFYFVTLCGLQLTWSHLSLFCTSLLHYSGSSAPKTTSWKLTCSFSSNYWPGTHFPSSAFAQPRHWTSLPLPFPGWECLAFQWTAGKVLIFSVWVSLEDRPRPLCFWWYFTIRQSMTFLWVWGRLFRTMLVTTLLTRGISNSWLY